VAAVIAVAILLALDVRITSTQSRWIAGAAAITVASALRFLVSPRGAVAIDATAAAGLAAVAIATSAVGGLAFFIAVVFLVTAVLAGARSERSTHRPIVAKSVLVAALVLLPLALLSPGGAIFVVGPVSIPFIAWAVWSLRRMPAGA